ncbi:hypothetical protein SPHINGO361_140387 [Sphingomonas sp. EC-HK361]|nr:hypothetical protein SPHINGO361_140387 [Sphingomonas sp. EC-HK361]
MRLSRPRDAVPRQGRGVFGGGDLHVRLPGRAPLSHPAHPADAPRAPDLEEDHPRRAASHGRVVDQGGPPRDRAFGDDRGGGLSRSRRGEPGELRAASRKGAVQLVYRGRGGARSRAGARRHLIRRRVRVVFAATRHLMYLAREPRDTATDPITRDMSEWPNSPCRRTASSRRARPTRRRSRAGG